MSPAVQISLLTLAVVAVGVVATQPTPRPRRRRWTNPGRSYAAVDRVSAAHVQPALSPPHGVSLQADKLELKDWSSWMASAPDLVRATLNEGSRDPNEIVANLFRRLFPEQSWPPLEGSPLHPTWNEMVAAVGRSLERPFKPHLEIVS